MSSPKVSPLRSDFDRAQVPLQQACLLWVVAWMAGQICAAAVQVASGADTVAEAGPSWLFATAMAGWVPLISVMWGAGRKWGIGSFSADWGLTFAPRDLLGVPIGVITQLVLVPLLYWPLQAIWPDAFAQDKVQERARDLFDSADGVGMVLLVLVVVVGAPVVEELVYRGLLQGAFTRRLSDWVGVVVVALWFAAIHFQPVETPGLFVVGLVLGACALVTRRLGMGVLAHMSFNATGLVLVAVAS